MRCGVGIEPFGTVYGSDTDDQALLFEKGQIPVYCCLRNIRMCFLQHLVNHLGGRMCVCVHQTVEDGVALAELLGTALIGCLLSCTFSDWLTPALYCSDYQSPSPMV